jgi:DNA repair exonuclease SbcCD ATPase subunit
MISLKSLTLENFRSFAGKHEILFDRGFYCIKGFSGVGKSNILLGISYALGLSPVPATQLQNLFTQDSMRVTLILDRDGERIEISRGKSPSYSDSVFTGSGASVVNEKVSKLFEHRLESVDLLTIRNQRTNGRFFSLSDSDKKAFLSTILGLSKLEDFIEYQKTALKEARDCVESYSFQLANSLRHLSQMRDDSPELISGYIDQTRERIREVDSELGDLNYLHRESSMKSESFFFKKSILVQENLEQTKQARDLIEAETAKLAEMSESLKDNQNSILRTETGFSKFEEDLKRVKDSALKNLNNLEKLSSSVCYTCKQQWEDSAKQKSLLKSENDELAIKEQRLVLRIEDSEKLLKILNKDAESLCAKILQQSEKIDELRKNLPVPNFKEVDHGWSLASDEALRLSKIINLANFKRSSLTKDEAIWSLKLERAIADKKQRSSMEEEVKNLKKEIAKFTVLSNDYKVLIDINKEFLTKIFDEILYEISNNVNGNLSLIPNVKNISFEFTTINTNLKGETKNKIETNIYKNGIKIPSLSGGQTSSLELLVDASVHSVISSRTGLSLNWLILDEPFEGLHPQDKEACLEVLKKLHPNKCVLIVDHSTETKEHFDGFFEVVSNEDGLSEIRTANDANI